MELRRSLKDASSRLAALFAAPFRDTLAGLDELLAGGTRALLLVGLGLLAGWWIYVPLHELAHAFGCLAAGGTVSRLEIDALYGGSALAELVPFVVPVSDYAGRLSGFDTGGSDRVYLATVLAPYLLTLWPGVWWLRRAAAARRALLFGAALPWALAPFVALPGDAYEIGSLVAVRMPPAFGRRELIGDDVLRRAAELDFAGDPALLGGFALACLFAIIWAFIWYAAAGWVGGRLGAPAPERASR